MKPRLYDPSRPFVAPITIVQMPPEQRIVLLGSVADAVMLHLHWVNGVSVPCITENCPYCHLETRPYGYAPCIRYTDQEHGKQKWSHAIMPFPFSAFSVLQKYPVEVVLKCNRKNGYKNGPIVFSEQGAIRENRPLSFDVMSHLQSLWGKRIARLAPVDTWKQFDPVETQPKAA